MGCNGVSRTSDREAKHQHRYNLLEDAVSEHGQRKAGQNCFAALCEPRATAARTAKSGPSAPSHSYQAHL